MKKEKEKKRKVWTKPKIWIKKKISPYLQGCARANEYSCIEPLSSS